MKKLILILFVALSFNIEAQYITNYAKNVKQTEIDGIYYYLPRNVIKLDFTIEEKQDIKGKFVNYTKEMLNTDNYIKENKVSYRITNVNINILTEADPNMIFYISPDDKVKESPKFDIALNDDGVLKSIGIDNIDSDYKYNNQFEKELDTDKKINEYYYIPLVEEDDDDIEEEENVKTKLTDKEVAMSVVEEIKKIRLAYFDLISGYQEIDYGSTMNYMIEELKTMENEYLSMFLGKSQTNVTTKTFYIIPEEGKNTVSIGRFSDIEGFNSKGGELIKINFVESSSSSVINKLSKDEIENVTYSNKIFYRNPADVTIQVSIGEKIISENRVKISQLGNVVLIPMNKMRLVFDTNTGQLLSIINE